MMQPEAQARGRRLRSSRGRGLGPKAASSLSPRPGVQSQYFCRARPTSAPLLTISAFPGRLFIGFPFLPSAARAPISSWGAWPTRRSSPSGTTRSPSTTWRGRRTCRSTSGSAGRAPKGETVRERERERDLKGATIPIELTSNAKKGCVTLEIVTATGLWGRVEKDSPFPLQMCLLPTCVDASGSKLWKKALKSVISCH